ncbi:phosphodiesterase [Baaleninema sp.]|uniref:phosphodiesterase n=1 Tax=Baaleninema sp. TaxID=3101197 RepID=UPI003D0880F0
MVTKIAQITDTHLFPDPDAVMRGVAPWHSLKAVLERVREENPDVLLLTGDLANDGDLEAYDRLFDLVSPLQVPTYCIPGNHDRSDILQKHLNRSPFATTNAITLDNWQVLLLDSTLENPKFGEGCLSEETLTQLETALTASNLPTAIALHHHPVETGIDWLDTINLINSSDFLGILDRFDRVKLVLFGHVHLEIDRTRSGVRFYGTPSTCTQVLPEPCHQSDRHPGFRWLELYPDGTHHSRVVRVPLQSEESP